MSVTGYPRLAARSDDLLGHPRGLVFLFTTEMWERFSFYGMRALLVLYMTKHLLLPGQADNVIGLNEVKGALESVFGRLDTQPFASHVFGLYSGLVYLTPIFGGLIADRLLGQHRTILIGAALMAVGHFMMAFEPLFLFALTTLIVGSGCFKPNMSAQVGTLYAPGDPRRQRAYSIFYVGINVGALLAPLVCGTLGEEVGWHYGFTAAGVGMTIALVIYTCGMRTLTRDELQATRADRVGQPPLDRNQWRGILALLVLFVPTIFFWAAYDQQGNTISLWADTYADRHINLGIWKGEIPVTWFQSVNPLLIVVFTPAVIAFWRWQAERGREPSTVIKMALGCAGVMCASLVMACAAWVAAGDSVTWLWLIGYFVLLTVGELYISPIGLSLVSKVSPPRMVSMLMGMWLGSIFIGNFFGGWLGSYWSSMNKMHFFLMIAAIAALAGLVIAALDRPLKTIVGD